MRPSLGDPQSSEVDYTLGLVGSPEIVAACIEFWVGTIIIVVSRNETIRDWLSQMHGKQQSQVSFFRTVFRAATAAITIGLALGILTGCGGGSTPSTSPAPPPVNNLACGQGGHDTYCGITALSCSAGATGYFYKEQHTDNSGNKHWVLCTPQGHMFLQRSVYNTSDTPANFSAKYGSNTGLYTQHENNRALQIGINSIDVYYSAYSLPVPTRDGGPGNAVQLPFLVFLGTQNEIYSNPSWFGWTDAGLKNLCDGQDSHGFTAFQQYCRKGGSLIQYDYMDPRWQTATDDDIQFTFTGPGGGGGNPYFQGGTVKTSPWVIGYNAAGDCGDYCVFTRGQGQDLDGWQFPLVAQVIATSAFDYTAAPVSESWQAGNHYLVAKLKWTCGNWNGSACDGSSYLELKYGTIANLKTAWGPCANSYTTFGSAGGFGSGTGLLDEDGAGSCFGSASGDYFTQSNIPANVITDLVTYSRTFVYNTYHAPIHSLKVTYGDTNHLMYCGNVGGPDDSGIRSETAQAMRDAGCDVIIMGWNGTYLTPVGQAANAAAYDATCSGGTCVPQTLWYAVSAQRDSPFAYCYPTCASGVYQNDYATQLIRGQHYGIDTGNILNSRGSNGDYYNMGIDIWSMMDRLSESTNYGFDTQDCSNLYDGIQATAGGIRGTGTVGNCSPGGGGNDPYGFATGGEAAAYGDFTDGVTAANAQNEVTLQHFFLP